MFMTTTICSREPRADNERGHSRVYPDINATNHPIATALDSQISKAFCEPILQVEGPGIDVDGFEAIGR